MSMFRRPGEDSSSEDESSTGETGQMSLGEDGPLSRINTLASAQSFHLGASSGLHVAPTPPTIARSNTSEHIRDVVFHSLLEDKAIRDAAEHLGKDPSDGEVQQLANKVYQRLACQLSEIVDDSCASEGVRQQRATARDGISRATRSYLRGLSSAAGATETDAATGSTKALMPLSLVNYPYESANKVFSNKDGSVSLQDSMPLFLHGHPGLHANRYARDYEEVALIGRGGYGKVYKVKHKLDESFYAVKRVVISASRLQRIQEKGAQEMEKLLNEVRSLARLDHNNVVRYHSAWLEFSYAPTNTSLSSAGKPVLPRRLLPGISESSFSASNDEHLESESYNFDLEESFGRSNLSTGADVVFEYSATGAAINDSRDEEENASFVMKPIAPRPRRGSLATVATLSSTKTHRSILGEANDTADDIEMIPRSHEPLLEESHSMMSTRSVRPIHPNHNITSTLNTNAHTHSDPSHPPISSPQITSPSLILNVQTSLYDTNLASFLSPTSPPPTHCFHPSTSLTLLASILSGVEYLHAQGILHRDLKPANILLALSTSHLAPMGSVDLASCPGCCRETGTQMQTEMREYLHATPKIGDFGLVAALGDTPTSTPAPATEPAVGTELYRPPPSENGGLSEKTDVFALGIMAFELLECFTTRSERVVALTQLRRGEMPDGFEDRVGEEVARLVGDMTSGVVGERCGVREVGKRIRRLLGEEDGDGL